MRSPLSYCYFPVLLALLTPAACLNNKLKGGYTSSPSTDSCPGQGVWDLTQAFPGAGTYSGVSNTPVTSDICDSANIVGVGGAAVCQSGTATTPAGVAHVLVSKEYWDSTGTMQTGTMANNGSWDLTGGSTFAVAGGAGYFSGVTAPSATNICDTASIAGISGSAVCEGAAGTGTEATATQLCDTTYLWESSGSALNGTRTCHEMGVPSTVSGLFYWLKADAIPPIIDTAFTSYWEDFSGSARNFYVGSVTLSPAYSTASINSLPAVSFDGSQFLSHTSSPGGTTATVFMVAKFNTTCVSGHVCTLFSNSFATGSFFQGAENGGGADIVTIGGTTTVDVLTTHNVFHLFVVQYNGATSQFWEDGVSQWSGNLGDTTAFAITRVGSTNFANNSMEGKIAELIFYNAVLSAPNRLAVQCYLSDKYNFGIAGC